MITFSVSAPGKVILFGEHAVVYGKTAVAASLDLRTHLDFKELPTDDTRIHISMPKVNLDKYISLPQVISFLPANGGPRVTDGHDKFLERVTEFVDRIGFETPQQKISLQSFLYMLIQVIQIENLTLKPFEIHINTTLSISSGLGSSASFSVCLAACFLRWSQLQSSDDSLRKTYASMLSDISRYALNCEKIMHGMPSGIDNSICTFGSIIEFRRGDCLKSIPGVKSLEVLLVDTKVERSTKLLVEGLANLKSKYPTVFDPLLESIDGVSREALDVIRRVQCLPEDESEARGEAYRELMILMEINQGLLTTCQVSHQSLDSICTIAKSYGLRAKLTGAGGGGYAYILLLPDTPSETIENLTAELTRNTFTVTLTNLGGSGVEFHN